MKKRLFIFLTLAGLAFFLSGYVLITSSLMTKDMPSMNNYQDYEQEWKQVDSLVQKGLPQSALALVEIIYNKARADHNSPQFIKTIIYKMKLKSEFEEDFMVKVIGDTRKEVEQSSFPVDQILHSLLAELYWRYYSMNRYKVLDRTETYNFDQEDIRTWDMKQLVSAVMTNYRQSLENAGELQKIPLKDYDPILITADDSKLYRPTLYDFLAHRALDFFMNSESGLTEPVYRFIMDSPDYFDPSNKFVSLDITTKDTMSLKFYAIRLFQDLLRFHMSDKAPDALVDVDLKRLQFVRDNDIIEIKDSLYIEALRSLLERTVRDSASAGVSYELAQAYYDRGQKYDPLKSDEYKWDIKNAWNCCNDALKRFPDTDGSKKCKNLLLLITSPALNLTMPGVNVEGQPFLSLISYKNAPQIYLRIIDLSPAEDKQIRDRGKRDSDVVKDYLRYPAYTSWDVKLPDDGDFQSHAAEIKIPGLPLGYYVILAATNGEFSPADAPVACGSCWISNISYISRKMDDGSEDFYVLDRDKGTPLSNVRVQTYYRVYDNNRRTYDFKPWDNYVTDGDGFFKIPALPRRTPGKTFVIRFNLDRDTLMTDNYFYQYSYSPEPPKMKPRTFFFTDRAIYRPGQTIYFKGIAIETDGTNNRILPQYKTTVTFFDVNGQKISYQELETDDYGSFNGFFIAPTGILTGEMSLSNESGSVDVSVEEYKRPNFEVTFDPVKGIYKLNEAVTVNGVARAYSGANVDHARVSYRVVRKARFPYWGFGWRDWFRSSPEMEIANGTLETDANGQFAITFKAIPDPTINAKYKPVFNYVVTADVTDINGETQSSSANVAVGYTALLVNVDIPETIDQTGKKDFLLSATNLNGQSEPVKVTLTVSKLAEPDRLFRDRLWNRPDRFIMTKEEFYAAFPHDVYNNENDVETWEVQKVVMTKSYNTATDTLVTFTDLSAWEPGHYLISALAVDSFGQKVENKKYTVVYSPDEKKIPVEAIFWFSPGKMKGISGENASFLAGTREKKLNVVYEIIKDNATVQREWLTLGDQQKNMTIPITEEYRGNIQINLVCVKYNRSFQDFRTIIVPYSNKELNLEFSSFRDKLTPGQEEEWNIKIKDAKGEKVAAEMVATMYDASLDAFVPHEWDFDIYRHYSASRAWDAKDAFAVDRTQTFIERTRVYEYPVERSYDQLNWFGFNYYGFPRYVKGIMMDRMISPTMALEENVAKPETQELMMIQMPPEGQGVEQEAPAKPEITPGLQVRRDFNETAFFYPDLRTDNNGDVIIRFKVPESLTRWKMLGLAHTTDLEYGQVMKELVTQKNLMIVPNAPRFFREGDTMAFTAKVVNLSDETLSGIATLGFFDAVSMTPVNLISSDAGQSFTVQKGQSAVVSWPMAVPVGGLQALTYRITAKAGSFSDGEEKALPVLTNRMLVTETLPLPVNGKQTKTFSFTKLIDSKSSATLSNFKLTLEFTSNPAWYAVQALPYLMEYPYECSEQVFSRYYANILASYIANSNPKIRAVFDVWKNYTPEALLSNLEKNQELKSLILEETPWVMEAKNESERKQRIALLFDMNRMANEQAAALAELRNMQLPNGAWPWFEGMPDSRYITQHIVCGMGKLNRLKVKDVVEDNETWQMIRQAVSYLDNRIREDYENIKKIDPDGMDKDHLGYLQIHYLYARSFFNAFNVNINLDQSNREAFEYFKGQAQKYWAGQNKYMQGMIALALHRFGDKETPAGIIRSLKEYALHSDEMGMYWRENMPGYFWYQAPVETQALLIEAFDEVANDTTAVEEMKVWLLKQKQTQEWPSTKATVDAIYALLLRGTDILAGEEQVIIKLDDIVVDPAKMENVKVEAGTGYFKTSWNNGEIKPDMGRVTVTKTDEGVAWGALYWQYFEQLDKITPHETSLKLSKALFLEKSTATGPVIIPVATGTTLHVGDRLRVRIELRVDRDMEYVHMKDMRAAAFEPVNVLSGYRYQGGLGYYESTRDASTNFFFGYLPKGTYVFEYPLVVSQEGQFSNGITTIQCMYAPEFAAHSQGIRVNIGE